MPENLKWHGHFLKNRSKVVEIEAVIGWNVNFVHED
jgi:hypothetical protein